MNRLARVIKKWLSRRLNIRLIAIFIICLLAATGIFVLIQLQNPIIYSSARYVQFQDNLNVMAHELGKIIEEKNYTIHDQDEIRDEIQKTVANAKGLNRQAVFQIYDEEGSALLDGGKSANVDLQEVLSYKLGIDAQKGNELNSERILAVYPLLRNDLGFLVGQIPFTQPDITSGDYNRTTLLSFIGSIGGFILVFLLLMRPIIRYIHEIESGVRKIAHRDWNYFIRVKGRDELSSLASNINWMTKELRDSFEKERALEQMKNELITNISHDLRTPLTSIIGYLGLLQDGRYKNEEEMKAYLSVTYNTSIKLNNLMNELFEYTKLSSHDTILEKEKVDLSGVLRQFIGEYVPIFEQWGLRLSLVVPEHATEIEVDIEKMVRVFDNLLSNAQKYSHPRSEVKVTLVQAKHEIVIAVVNRTDNIPEEELSRLFDKFYRRDQARSSRIQGSGLGLAITKRIVDLHGGRIWAESKGDTLQVFIALPKSESDEPR
ncbi:HAMP domain-containing histidine kinase [Ectobacillus sp. JY-23]|uniref:sensor histidine kinase n=1 Tax=Ectobacillus sp. JY-23 TaxID=2933872 RepID=UPI001FF682B8|nr:HAMP domain-containing sensor histidine kinase [Ectobacillus sp. JY-23]UOY91942.1 HAMP domain-containing histidine kinase [Ectobacillus sp. JY-23]